MSSNTTWKKAERDIAKFIGRMWCGNPKAFKRMPLQGRRLEEFYGDIVPEDVSKLTMEEAEKVKRFPYIVDVKKRKSWDFNHLIFSGKSVLLDWWVKLHNQGKATGKTPLMFVKVKGTFYIVVEEKNWNVLESLCFNPSNRKKMLVYKGDLVNLIFVNLEVLKKELKNEQSRNEC